MTSRPLSPQSPQNPHHHHDHGALLLVSAAITSSILLLLLLFSLLYYFLFLRRRRPTLPFDSAAAPLRRFSHRHLRSATRGFDPSLTLGQGASASVFRGILPDGKSVAVKRLAASSSEPGEFLNELRVLSALPPSPFVVSLLGYCVDGRRRNRRRLLVYEYMCNGSLQDALFGSESSDLGWDRRLAIILDVGRALSFLHHDCDPPVVHGDVKPSNVLLGSDFRAKICDFGLSRIKSEADEVDPGFDLFSQELSPSQELVASSVGYPTPSSNFRKNGDEFNGPKSPKRKEAINVTSCEDELYCKEKSNKEPVESSLSDNGKAQWGKDWWLKQDGSGELCSKEYVREWIGTQIGPSANPDWDEERNSSRSFEFSNLNLVEKSEATEATHFTESASGPTVKKGDSVVKKKRQMREWWKEEYFAEISNKGSKCSKGLNWFRSRSSRGEGGSNSRRGDDLNIEISFRKGWKKRRSRSMGSDMWSGDLYSRELSSTTTSVRGTVCYIAPESGGYGNFMEKADIYSFGVLILVIVSGRRPLHVLSSPMNLEKANLISWARQLTQTGNVLDLVDERLKGLYDKKQVSLCINLALLCLQRTPELRPESREIVKILNGEMGLPAFPIEFSPSPTLKKICSKSRRKPKLIA